MTETLGLGRRRRDLSTLSRGAIALGACTLTFLAAGLLAPTVAFAAPSPSAINAQMAQAGNPAFYDTSFAVVPGSTVSIHWSGGPTALLHSGVHLLVTSTVPDFSSPSTVHWPTHTSPTPRWDGSGWVTGATAMSVVIPSNAAPGTAYQVAVAACTSTKCVEPAATMALNVPVAPTTWTTKSYQTDFSGVATFPVPGEPFATAFLASNNSIWNASEYSHDIMEVPSTAKHKARVLTVPTTARTVPAAFRKPFAFCNASSCRPGSTSALSEQLTTTSDGWIWTTFGGWRVYSNGQRDTGSDTSGKASAAHNLPTGNHSEVVGFDAATGHFCTYLVPGNNTQVAGVAAVGSAPDTQIWFVASTGPGGEGFLGSFDPSSTGGGCNGHQDAYDELPATVVRLTWPRSGAQWPVQIAADPSSSTLWITNFDPYSVNGTLWSGIDRIDISSPAQPTVVQRYGYPTTSRVGYFGAKPWSIVAPPDSNYVYAIDNGDAELVRINKVTNQLQEVAIPLTSDLENGFGLAISSGRLYFTLANDYNQSQVQFGGASTFGYIDLSSWPDGALPASGVMYTGLGAATDPGVWADYRSIATGPTGQVALTDGSSMVRLSPRDAG